jgi:hypothetical protein
METKTLKIADLSSLIEEIQEGKAVTYEIKRLVCSKITELMKPSFFDRFNRVVNENEELKQCILETFALPEKAILRYFPKTKKIKILDGDRSLNQIIKLDKDDLDEIKKIQLSDSSQEYIDLDLARSKDSIFLYKKNSTISFVKNFFGEKTLIAATVFLAGTISTSSVNLENYLDHSKTKTALSTKLLEVSDNRLNYEFISSAIEAINSLSSWDYKSTPIRKEIESFVEKYSNGYSDLMKSKKVSVNYEADEIYSQIKSLPNMSDKSDDDAFLMEISQQIREVSEATGIDYKVFLSIIKTESSFKQDSVSSTGDFSLAQINFKKWDAEFRRLNLNPIDFAKLKTDHGYSIELMGQILKILKKRHKSDNYWFARYHSSTPHLKAAYASKLKRVISRLEDGESARFLTDVNHLISKINQLDPDNSVKSLELFKEGLSRMAATSMLSRAQKHKYARN